MTFPLVSGSLCLGIISRTLLWDAEREGEETIAFWGPNSQANPQNLVSAHPLKRVAQSSLKWLKVAASFPQKGNQWIMTSNFAKQCPREVNLWFVLMGICWDHMIISSGF